MSNRVVIQEGYIVPSFDGVPKRRRRAAKHRSYHGFSGAMKAQQNVMKSCAKAWSSGRRLASSYRAQMKKCL